MYGLGWKVYGFLGKCAGVALQFIPWNAAIQSF